MVKKRNKIVPVGLETPDQNKVELRKDLEQPKLIKDENHGREATEPSENN